MLCHLLLRHVTDEFIDVVILNLLLISSHNILHILVHHIHSFLFSHELLHGLVVIGVLHLVVSPTHYFSHPWHHVLHWLVHTHLLQSNSKKMYSKVTVCSWVSRLLYFWTIWLFLSICWAITFWACLIILCLLQAISFIFSSSNPFEAAFLGTKALSFRDCTLASCHWFPLCNPWLALNQIKNAF